MGAVGDDRSEVLVDFPGQAELSINSRPLTVAQQGRLDSRSHPGERLGTAAGFARIAARNTSPGNGVAMLDVA